MQSTGHTSTQERSLTLMHGSAMMYGIPSPECSPRSIRAANGKPRLRLTSVKGPLSITDTLGYQFRGVCQLTVLRERFWTVSWILVGIIHQRRKAETRA